jgi:hypothetical protein
MVYADRDRSPWGLAADICDLIPRIISHVQNDVTEMRGGPAAAGTANTEPEHGTANAEPNLNTNREPRTQHREPTYGPCNESKILAGSRITAYGVWRLGRDCQFT